MEIIFFLKGEITPPQKSRNFDQFDYAAFLEKNNIKAVFQAKELRIGTKKRNTPLLLIKNYRRFLYTHIENTLPQPTSAYTAALVLGERTNFSEESYRDFQELGVVHLLAISGLHIQVLLKAVYYLLIRIRLPHEYAKISIVIFIPFYIFLTGAGPSATRAGIMALLSYLLPLFMKKIDPFTALCASGIICLFIRPMQLFDVGFQLSYALTAGIILSNQKILRRFTSNWSQMFVLSWITTWISIPIVCYHFYQISWTGIFLNLIYVPLFVFFRPPIILSLFLLPDSSSLWQSFTAFHGKNHALSRQHSVSSADNWKAPSKFDYRYSCIDLSFLSPLGKSKNLPLHLPYCCFRIAASK
ncbi:ComEC/Rec2 family competence protein [Listeria grayi]|uniref:ComEC/Rec2-related protein domain-containing protein n=1 Tax=Listeria grayi FSL F6-1183 TaxID=1265827 RepID=A0A829RBF7_LISGR|nr:ComEC/Rec2 family competence protein [Listeria grayi]EUJ29921.1 hypothetical protein LMUR_02432 [Listeria grayi FSL F6-1183]